MNHIAGVSIQLPVIYMAPGKIKPGTPCDQRRPEQIDDVRPTASVVARWFGRHGGRHFIIVCYQVRLFRDYEKITANGILQ
jgi:hypothetical protein